MHSGIFSNFFKKKVDKMPSIPALPGAADNTSRSEKKRQKKHPRALIPIRLISFTIALAGLVIESMCFKWERQVSSYLWNGGGTYQLLACIAFSLSITVSAAAFCCWVCANHLYVTVANVILDGMAMGFLLAVAVLNTIFVMNFNFMTTPQRKELCSGRVEASQQEGKSQLPGGWKDLGFETEEKCFAHQRRVSDLEWIGVGLCYVCMIVHFLSLILGASRLAMRRFADRLAVIA